MIADGGTHMIDQHDIIHSFEPMWGNWYAEELIGEGSFGRVYRATRKEGNRSFYSAIKLIPIPKSQSEIVAIRNQGMDDVSVEAYLSDMTDKLINEIEIMNRLKGETNIVSYEDHQVIYVKGSLQRFMLIRMELLIPLSAYIADNVMDSDEVRRLGIGICNALEVCEANNIIHRDIKDGNVFMNMHGTFKLGDFGIARELDPLRHTMSMRGTPAYVAPEMYNGKHYDGTVDIYSLGIMMYKLLNNGRYPFLPPAPAAFTYAQQDEAFYRRVSGEMPPPPANGDKLLKDAVMIAIDPEPSERFRNAAAFRAALNCQY